MIQTLKNNKVLVITVAILVVLVIVLMALISSYVSNLRSSTSNDMTERIFEIEEGSSINQIAIELKEAGYISSVFTFKVYTRLNNKVVLAGPFLLSKDMTMQEIIEKISGEETAMRKITIPEGWRLEQIAKYLDDKGYADYQKFVELGEPHRGKLFPDTFFITVETTEEELIEMMLEDYDTRTKDLTVSKNDLILASIVEREAITDEERPKIAGVFKNRLNVGMKLEADPTVFYSNDANQLVKMSTADVLEYKFWEAVAFDQYPNIDSKFNTYINKGLPPAAICNPGLKSIKAAVESESHDYYYFFHSKKSKEIYFSKTEDEHESKKAKYLGS